MGIPNNKKYTNEAIELYMRENYPEYTILMIEEPCEENNSKPRVRFTNGYETKFAYFDNIKRGKFSFTIYTPEYIQDLVKEYSGDIHIKVESFDDSKCNRFSKFKITNKYGKEVILSGDNIKCIIRNGTNLFHDKRTSRWKEEDVYDFLVNSKYNFTNIKVVHKDKNNIFDGKNCEVYFTYDKVELNARFRTVRDRVVSGDDSILNLNRGEKFYTDMLKDKFNITNVGFDRLYKHTTQSGKMTYCADIYNKETGEKVERVLTDNLKKRGFWFKSYEGEKIISNELNNRGIRFNTQQTFKDCSHIQTLRFDFYIPDLNTCIEYDGEFHYMQFDFTGGEKGLKKQQERDEIKNNYCKENSINLVRIPYFKKKEIPNIIEDIVSTYERP